MVSDKDLASFKKSCAKEGIEYKSEEEFRKAAQDLYDLAGLLYRAYCEDRERKDKLKDNPKGFAFASDGRMCKLCGDGVRGDMWFDKWGMKCFDCQKALNKKIIPGYVFNDDNYERHITESRLAWKASIRSQTIRKLVRQGKLKARILPQGTCVFLQKENPNLFDVIETELEQLASKKAR